MKVTIDFETRSAVDLKKCGMHKYAEGASTDILCMAIKLGTSPASLWVPGKFRRLLTSMTTLSDQDVKDILFCPETEITEAHNIGFEKCMWEAIMVNRYGFPPLPEEKLRCSAAKAASYAIPRDLGGACKAIGVPQQKDYVGYKIMMKMCKPRKPVLKERNADPQWADKLWWNEDPQEFELLCKYCLQDTEAEHALSEALYELSPEELEVFRLDQKINSRGIYVDLEAVNKIISMVEAKETSLFLEIKLLTSGRVKSVKQVAVTLEWILENGVELTDFQKGTVKEAMKQGLPLPVKRMLEIRQSMGKSSVSKLKAMVNWACADSRVRGGLMYHGASTGRWSGKGIQPHNYPRDSFGASDIDNILACPDFNMVDILYDCTIIAASKCLRGMICAAPGKQLYCADFSSIEAIVVAWLAGQQHVLDAFSDGLDLYKVAAMDIYNKKYEEVDKIERSIGKVAVLALGFQGWLGAFQSMADVYGVNVPEEQAKEIILAWRGKHPAIVAFWRGVELAAINTVKTGKPMAYGRIKFGIRGRFLHCRLPSGRLLSYCDPSVETITTDWGQEKEVVVFWGVNSMTKQWSKQKTYGGKLTENIVQATARDLMAEAMLRVENAGFPVVLTIHDEILAELPIDTDKTLDQFTKLMTEVPEWAYGCPVRAEGWQGKRYRKG